MTSSNNGTVVWLKPFLTGFITAITLTQFLKKQKKQQKQKQPHQSQITSSASSSTSRGTTPVVFDSPTLDQRILRKAEAAILNRTSRLIIVVERCTNDHNYSAILRTAEALGVQHVYIIAPQSVKDSLNLVLKGWNSG